MRVIYMGTPEFAVAPLHSLIGNQYDVVAVFTQPDRPKGRGKKLQSTPVKELALAHGLMLYQPIKLRESSVVEIIKSLEPDVIVVVAYGQILSKEILEIPTYGCINVHASLLPKYRGAAPIHRAIIDGEKKTGVTTMYMDVGLDTGDMLLKKEVLIGADETAGELRDRLMALGADTLIKTLNQVQRGTLVGEKQNDLESSYAAMLDKGLGQINWNQSAEAIRNLIRGTIPWPMAYTTYLGNRVKIWKSRIEESEVSGKPGEILKVEKSGIFVKTGQGTLVIERIQFSGKKPLDVREYLAGNTIEKGVLLGEEDGN
ncbi:methionyl-tRNA formyltransferase [Alkaliphilus metalliredigens QYMF]|uniref:Methionyl-tRNA formyltransferase n=1 Tax=Alkaliphilus metalliredigens (strain QYMF) TaxID=293826 RepID=FMT_ALKMQ|nr:methionyl-tRNA formyltransferase [Alkaliphilus metalliredigens]A6TRW7.1 RecName: Full=Methionyl-tRNA formyltransferase [Alkaliphilus metalliredigens QYMF]ABR48935.1 methionyl-tRNA formyltransferase [Alkaliphilus metalliredigens QYMF]